MSATGLIVASAGWSGQALKAARRAADIGARRGARGLLVHTYPYGLKHWLSGIRKEDVARHHLKRLDELAGYVYRKTGFMFETQVHGTALPRHLAPLARITGASLTILEQGEAAWGTRVAAHQLLRSVYHPVLLVKRDPGKAYARALVIVDSSCPSTAGIMQAHALAPGAELVLLSILDRTVENRLRYARADEEQIRQANLLQREQAFGHLSRLADGANVPVRDVLKIVEQGYAPTLIRHAERRIQADLLVLPSDNASGLRRCFFRSGESEVMARSDCDILMVPAAA